MTEKTPGQVDPPADILASLPRKWEGEAYATNQGAAYGNGLRDCARELRDVLAKGADGLAAKLAAVTAERDEARVCGHEFVLGDVGYRCERMPHEIDGYGSLFRHAAGVDAELAEGTDEGDGRGDADLVTWGEDGPWPDGPGEGQDWELAWGTIAEYIASDVTQMRAERNHAREQLAAVTAERDKLQRACQTLGHVVELQARDLYAMWIDVSRGDLKAVRERVLNSIPDVDDHEPDEQWNGTETGGEWFWRTRQEPQPTTDLDNAGKLIAPIRDGEPQAATQPGTAAFDERTAAIREAGFGFEADARDRLAARTKDGLMPMGLEFDDADPVARCLIGACQWHGHGDCLNDAVLAWTAHLAADHRDDWPEP